MSTITIITITTDINIITTSGSSISIAIINSTIISISIPINMLLTVASVAILVEEFEAQGEREMEGDAGNGRVAAVAKCITDIKVADFVALDLEFSGLFLSVDPERKLMAFEEYFKKCRESVPQFLPLQLGVCCGRCVEDRGGLWEFRAHELNLWPQERRIFTSDLESLRFLRAHGFDFNAFFEQAHTYNRLPPLPKDGTAGEETTSLPPEPASQVLAALRSSRVPLVFHNGFLDVLHLFDKFVDTLPEKATEFSEAWIAQFPLLFDTRLIAQEGRYKVFKRPKGLWLEELHRHLSAFSNEAHAELRFERAGPLPSIGPSHGSAGQDAVMTAEVFVMEIDLWLRAEVSAAARASVMWAGRKRRRQDAAASITEGEETEATPSAPKSADENASTGFSSPSLLMTHRVCKRLHNRLAIIGAVQRSMYLDVDEARALHATVSAPTRAEGTSD